MNTLAVIGAAEPERNSGNSVLFPPPDAGPTSEKGASRRTDPRAKIRGMLRTIVRSAYDLQKLRQQIGSRIVAKWKFELGQMPGELEATLNEDSKRQLALIRALYKRVTDGVVAKIKNEKRSEENSDDLEEEGEEELEEEEDSTKPKTLEEELTGISKMTKSSANKKLTQLVNRVLGKQYSILTENKKRFPKRDSFVGNSIISSYTELCLVAEYVDIEKAENVQFGRLTEILELFPIWNEFLVKIYNLAEKMAGVIISEISIYDRKEVDKDGNVVMDTDGKPKMKLLKPSSLHKYAGLDCGPDGKGRSRREEHLIKKSYINKKGKKDVRNSITFNPWLKTKLVGVLGPLMVKSRKSPYRSVYDNYKHRLENHPLHGTHNDAILDPNHHPDPEKGEKQRMLASKGHRHNMAVRYAVKIFLIDLYKKWRELEGLYVSPPYHEGVLGHKHGQS